MIRSFGSGEQGELTFIDLISMVSFIVGLQNLDLNIAEEDLNKQTRDVDEFVASQTKQALSEIHEHLKRQDDKISRILEVLEVSGYERETT